VVKLAIKIKMVETKKILVAAVKRVAVAKAVVVKPKNLTKLKGLLIKLTVIVIILLKLINLLIQ
jgi:hypothetical protein